MPKISKKQQAKMQRARKRAMKLRAVATRRSVLHVGGKKWPVRNMRMPRLDPNDIVGIPVYRPGLGALTRGGLVTSPTGQTFRLSPPPPRSPNAPRGGVYATRQPGTVYDADRDGWIARADAGWDDDELYDAGYDVDSGREEPEITALRVHSERAGWGPQAVEMAARAARSGSPGLSVECADTQDAANVLIQAVHGKIPGIRCGPKALTVARVAATAAAKGKCARANHLIKQAKRFCKRRNDYGYEF